MNEKQKETVLLVGGVVVVIAVFAGIGKIFSGLAEALGLSDSKADLAAESAVKTAEQKDYFSPNFIQSPPAPINQKITLLTDASAKAKATKIYKAIGVLYDSPEEITAAFSDLKTKSQVTSIAIAFRNLYGKELLNFLNLHLDTEDQKKTLATILERLNRLPKYIIGGKP